MTEVSKFAFQDCTFLYEELVRHSCLCKIKNVEDLPKLWLSIFDEHEIFEVVDAPKLEFQLLNSSIIFLVAEKLILSSYYIGFVCPKLHYLLQSLPLIWEKTLNSVHDFLHKNKFLVRSLLKALAAVMCLFPPMLISSQTKKLFELLQSDAPASIKTNILNLFFHLLNYKIVKTHYSDTDTKNLMGNNTNCGEKIAVLPLLISDVHYACCKELSNDWSKFVKCILGIKDLKENQELLITLFLVWKNINDHIVTKDFKDLSERFLSFTYVEDFSYNSVSLLPQAFRIYLEIMIQIFSQNTGLHKWNDENFTNILVNCATFEFFEKLPISSSSPGFCGSQIERTAEDLSENFVQCDVTLLKKVTLVILKLLAVEKNSAVICMAFQNLDSFVRKKMTYSSNVPAHTWLLNLFFDQDDCLLEAMFSVLSTYLNLNSDSEGEYCEVANVLKVQLNPHKIFMEFAAKLGYSHHVLLEFLMSNETCMLLYITKYLKFILMNWKAFAKVYQIDSTSSLCEQNTQKLLKPAKDTCAKARFNVEHTRTKLVSYSSSSSSDEETNNLPGTDALENDENSPTNLHTVMLMFKNLKSAIEKLTEKEEFPYNAKPLLDLIKQCEIMYKYG